MVQCCCPPDVVPSRSTIPMWTIQDVLDPLILLTRSSSSYPRLITSWRYVCWGVQRRSLCGVDEHVCVFHRVCEGVTTFRQSLSAVRRVNREVRVISTMSDTDKQNTPLVLSYGQSLIQLSVSSRYVLQ